MRDTPALRREYLQDKCCERCGKPNADTRLVFLPRDADAPTAVPYVFNYAPQRREEILKQVKLVCWAPCRSEEMVEQGRWQPLAHGTSRKYQLGCRCVLCKQYQVEKGRRYRAKEAGGESGGEAVQHDPGGS